MAPNNEKPTTSKGQNESEKDVKQETAEKALKDEIEKADEGESLIISTGLEDVGV